MSKRLEDMKRKYRYYDDSKQFVVIPKGNFNHLIEQAGRVEGLREANADLVELGKYILKHFRGYIDGTTTETAQKVMDSMHKQNKCYREVLRKILTDDSLTYRQVIDLVLETLEGDPHESI